MNTDFCHKSTKIIPDTSLFLTLSHVFSYFIPSPPYTMAHWSYSTVWHREAWNNEAHESPDAAQRLHFSTPIFNIYIYASKRLPYAFFLFSTHTLCEPLPIHLKPNFLRYKDTSTERYILPDHIFQSKVLTPSFCEKFKPTLTTGFPRWAKFSAYLRSMI